MIRWLWLMLTTRTVRLPTNLQAGRTYWIVRGADGKVTIRA